MADSGNLDLLFAHADDHLPVLEESPESGSAADEAGPIDEQKNAPTELANITANANDLVEQRWAIVAAHGSEGDQLCAWVRELVAKRAQDQQLKTDEVLQIRVPPRMDAKQAEAWKQREFPQWFDDSEAKRPRYLCILGDVDQVSLPTQEVLAMDGFPGRLVCADEAGYRGYVDKVLRWEGQPPEHERPRALFYTVHDGTGATRSGHEKLLSPCFAMARHDWDTRGGDGAFRSTQPQLVGHADGPNPDEFLSVAEGRQPTLLFSMSHGMGPPRRRRWTPTQARERQGAMVFGTENPIMPTDLANGWFLPGGLWFYYACFGAGTPNRSAYHHWLDMLAASGMQGMSNLGGVLKGLDQEGGFTSGVAQAALANPKGPLGILGHIDLAWSYGFEEIRVEEDNQVQGSGRARDYYNLLVNLVAGERLGVVILRLQMALHEVSGKLNRRYNRYKASGQAAEGSGDDDRIELGNLWMRRQDLLGYVILGDPAVRLPLMRDSERRGAGSTRGIDRSIGGSATRSAGRGGLGRMRPQTRSQARPEQTPRPTLRRSTTRDGRGQRVAPERPAPGNIAETVRHLERAVKEPAQVTRVARKLGFALDKVKSYVHAYEEAGRRALTELLSQEGED